MKIVGLTGGIGSGKTTVANMFKTYGVPVYNSDIEAKALMNRSKVIKRKLIQLFGEEAYTNNKLNRPYIASLIFNNQELLKKMNAIVHPKVGHHFKRWLKKHAKEHYIIKESAILFETGIYKNCDYIILVTAPVKSRISRVIERDNTSSEKVQAVIDNQFKESENRDKVHFVINNLSLENTKNQVLEIHNKLLIYTRKV